MKKFLMLFCPYGEDTIYMGHRIHRIEAPNMEEAEKIGHQWLVDRNYLTVAMRDKFEYYVIEVVDQVGPRVYSTAEQKRL